MKRFALILALLASATGCSFLTNTVSSNKVSVTTYAMDANGKIQPLEAAVAEGVWSDGEVTMTIARGYKPTGNIAVKDFEYIEVHRVDDSTNGAKVAAVKAKSGEAFATSTAAGVTSAGLTYLTGGQSSSLGALPAIIQALSGVSADAHETEPAITFDRPVHAPIAGDSGSAVDAIRAFNSDDATSAGLSLPAVASGDEKTTLTVTANDELTTTTIKE